MEYLEGSMTKSEAIAETVSLTKRYARRQMSWFRRDPQIVWRDADQVSRDTLVDDVVTWLASAG
jgi:tRNA dimethylallyltransferase